jgi:hypothetical protein
MKNVNILTVQNRLLAIDFQVLKNISGNFLIAAAKAK